MFSLGLNKKALKEHNNLKKVSFFSGSKKLVIDHLCGFSLEKESKINLKEGKEEDMERNIFIMKNNENKNGMRRKSLETKTGKKKMDKYDNK